MQSSDNGKEISTIENIHPEKGFLVPFIRDSCRKRRKLKIQLTEQMMTKFDF